MKYFSKLTYCFLLTAFVLGMSGCSSVGSLSTSEQVAPGLAIGSATLGAFATEDADNGTRIATTAGSGLVGWLVGMFTTQKIQKEKKEEFRSGYELGQSNAVKSLYWNIQSLHEAKNQPENQVIYYQIPADYPSDGANRTPGSVLMPVTEVKK